MSDFVICISNESNPTSLIVGKAYRKLPDADAKAMAYPVLLMRTDQSLMATSIHRPCLYLLTCQKSWKRPSYLMVNIQTERLCSGASFKAPLFV